MHEVTDLKCSPRDKEPQCVTGEFREKGRKALEGHRHSQRCDVSLPSMLVKLPQDEIARPSQATLSSGNCF